MSPNPNPDYGIAAFQRQIEALYFDRDRERGIEATFVWFVEEIGELAKELRKTTRNPQRLQEEIGDVFAWLSTLASLLNIEMTDAARLYADGCPKCRRTPCSC